MLYYDKIDVFKKVMLIRQENQYSALFVTIVYFLGFKFQPYICSRCHDSLVMSINLKH